jgi:hypothetical protein
MANGGNIHGDDDYDDYDDSQDNLESQHKNYFKFDPDAWDAWGKLLTDALSNIVEYPSNVWYIGPKFPKGSVPVNDYLSSTGSFKHSLYLGNNHQKQPIYKTKYFIHDVLNTSYKNHIVANAVHFLQQPHYYRGMFDILN